MKISVMGFICADIIKKADKEYIELGGSAGNVASILRAMGDEVYVWFPQYQGLLGQFLNEKLLCKEIKIIEFAKTKNIPPQIILEYGSENEKAKYLTRGKSDKSILSKVYLPTELHINKNLLSLQETNLLYIDRMSGGIHLAIDMVSSDNGWVFYEPNGCRTYEVFLKTIGCADIVKFSSERIFESYIERARDDLIDAKTKIMLFTQGEKGVKLSLKQNNGSFSEWINIKISERVNIVDSIGAGDWLSGTFIKLFLQKYPSNDCLVNVEEIQDIVVTAQKVATFSCNFIGAQKVLDDKVAWKEIKKISGIKD